MALPLAAKAWVLFALAGGTVPSVPKQGSLAYNLSAPNSQPVALDAPRRLRSPAFDYHVLLLSGEQGEYLELRSARGEAPLQANLGAILTPRCRSRFVPTGLTIIDAHILVFGNALPTVEAPDEQAEASPLGALAVYSVEPTTSGAGNELRLLSTATSPLLLDPLCPYRVSSNLALTIGGPKGKRTVVQVSALDTKQPTFTEIQCPSDIQSILQDTARFQLLPPRDTEPMQALLFAGGEKDDPIGFLYFSDPSHLARAVVAKGKDWTDLDLSSLKPR